MENFMEKQTEYEQEIDLVSLFFAVLHKYRQIFAAAVACAVLFGAVGMFKHVRSQKAAEAASKNGEEIVRTAEEQKYEEDMVEYRAAQTAHDKNVASYNHQLKQNEADQARAEFDIKNAQEYIDKSVLNSLDPSFILPPITRSCRAWTTRTRITPARCSALIPVC